MNVAQLISSLPIALALGATGCPPRCEPAPDTRASEFWSHVGSDAGNASCASSMEYEPNESMSEANPLGETSVCNPRTIDGQVADDVDVFYTWGEPCDDARPFVKLTSGPDDLRVCFFVSCSEGRTALDLENSCPGGKPFHTVEGLLGCCRTGPGSVEVHVNCDAEYTTFGTVPELDGYVYVDRTGVLACESYGVLVQF